MKLYLQNADYLIPGAVLPGLDEARRARILRCQDAAEQRRLAAAGLLLAAHFPTPPARTPTGKPFLPNAAPFSLSHGGALAALLIAEADCGVDVERIERTISPRTAAHLFLPEELSSGRAPMWLWTRKEAVMKLDGRGLGLDARSFSVLGTETRLCGRRIALGTEIYRGHFISWAVALARDA